MVIKISSCISSFDFTKNIMDDILLGNNIYFLVLYVDDILLTTNDKGMLHDMKQFISKSLKMKYMVETSYVLGIRSIKIELNTYWLYQKKPIPIKY